MQVLSPVKAAVEALCRQDANLLTADATIKYMLDVLDKMNQNFLAEEILAKLEIRLSERRTDLSGVLEYLHCGRLSTNSGHVTIFRPMKKNEIKKILTSLAERLFAEASNQTEHNNLAVDEVVEELEPVPEPDINISQQFQVAISKHLAAVNHNRGHHNVERAINREMAQLEDDGSRGRWLELIYNALKTIPPTSVEAERAFSASGKICMKIRSRLNDNILNDLCFLRSYFKKQN